MLRSATLAALLSTSALAQEAPEAPRVDGQSDAAAAQVLVNEVDADAYPEVTLFATVTQNGSPVTGLGAQDFRVREDEVDQTPLTVEEQLPALSVVVTMDVSGSMSDRLADAQAAATSFVEGLGEQDSMQLVTFAREVEVVTPMTSTKGGVTDAIAELAARGDTALYDALLQSVDLVADRSGRRAVVVLSDGVDDDGTGQPLSEATAGDVLGRAAEAQVPIFVVGLGTELDEAGLTQIASESGALYLPAPTPEELGEVYGRIGAQLSGQYAISYTSSLPQDGTARRVSLEALGARGSKEYTPTGGAASAASEPEQVAAAPAEGCAPLEALQAARPELEQAKSRRDQGLIDSEGLIASQQPLVDEALLPAMEEPPSGECVLTTAREFGAMAEAVLTPYSPLNAYRQQLTALLAAELQAMPEADAALRQVKELDEAGFFETAARWDIQSAILTREVEGIADTDAALARVKELSDAGLVDDQARTRVQSAILERE